MYVLRIRFIITKALRVQLSSISDLAEESEEEVFSTPEPSAPTATSSPALPATDLILERPASVTSSGDAVDDDDDVDDDHGVDDGHGVNTSDVYLVEEHSNFAAGEYGNF